MLSLSQLSFTATLFLYTSLSVAASDSSIPRGVGPEFAKHYASLSTTKSFTCISHPSIKIPANRVNDDYCDCPDGSDEPGTAACSYLSSLSPVHPPSHPSVTQNETLLLPGFYCKNVGHRPSYTRFENVNDGVCDYDTCCDGSDEYSGVGGVRCEDRCASIGKEYRKKEADREAGLGRAMAKKKELQTRADTLRQEVEDKIDAANVRVAGLERMVEEREKELVEVEKREKSKVVKSGPGQGKMAVFVGLAKGRVDELRSSLAKTKGQRDEMKKRVVELEMVLQDLKREYNPNFNDAGVKKAVQSWEDYAARPTEDHWSDAEDRDLAELTKEDGPDSGINWSEFSTDNSAVEETNDAAAIYTLSSYLPPPFQSWLDTTLTSLREILVSNGILPSSTSTASGTDSPATANARRALEDSKRDLTNAQSDLNSAQSDLEKDYGPMQIFRATKDDCASLDIGEYTYKHCFLGRTSQQSRKSGMGGETNMGNFEHIDVETVDPSDEEVGADGQAHGLSSSKEDASTGSSGNGSERIVLVYENGQSCWNGPNRRTRVVLGCAEKHEVWDVREVEKCVYRMRVGTPSVCGGWTTSDGRTEGADVRKGKDEL